MSQHYGTWWKQLKLQLRYITVCYVLLCEQCAHLVVACTLLEGIGGGVVV